MIFAAVKLESLDEILLILPGELEHRTRLSPGDIKCALNAAAAFKLRNKHLISGKDSGKVKILNCAYI